MKKLIIVLFFSFVGISTYAQLENIKISNDSSIIINKVYAGMISGSLFSVDSLHADKFVNIRFGVLATWQMNKYVAFKSMCMFDTDLNKNTWGLQQFYVELTPSKKHSLQFGNMATLSTEQRPYPITGNGQFETWTESQIPGQALGVKYTYKPNTNWLIGGGVAMRDKQPEYHGKLKVKNFTLSGYYRISEDNSGLALTYAGKKIYNTCVWKNEEVISNIFVWELSSSKNISFYADIGYDFVQEDFIRGEVGLLKTFASKYSKGLFGLGYQYEMNTINAYLFIHL